MGSFGNLYVNKLANLAKRGNSNYCRTIVSVLVDDQWKWVHENAVFTKNLKSQFVIGSSNSDYECMKKSSEGPRLIQILGLEKKTVLNTQNLC